MAQAIDWLKKPLVGACCLRSLNYFVEYHTLQTLSSLLTKTELRSARFTRDSLTRLLREIRDLIENDVDMVIAEKLPLQILWIESPIAHARRVPKIVIDGVRLSRRRKNRQTKQFNSKAKSIAKTLPEYYRRNFHFQTDGYLSEHSAELYDHQVELLFAGVADAMRRIVLPDLLAEFANRAPVSAPSSAHDSAETRGKTRGADRTHGTSPSFLELGCGTGAMTRNMSLAFSKAQIIATDLSAPYLAVARRRLSLNGAARRRQSTNVELREADAANLPFDGGRFDLVYSTFMFHELPRDVREQVAREAYRVLKPGGLFVYIDSIQHNDKPQFNEVLRQFPRDFHEPFYRDYVQTPMPTLVEPAGFEHVKTWLGFLAKGQIFRKSAS